MSRARVEVPGRRRHPARQRHPSLRAADPGEYPAVRGTLATSSPPAQHAIPRRGSVRRTCTRSKPSGHRRLASPWHADVPPPTLGVSEGSTPLAERAHDPSARARERSHDRALIPSLPRHHRGIPGEAGARMPGARWHPTSPSEEETGRRHHQADEGVPQRHRRRARAGTRTGRGQFTRWLAAAQVPPLKADARCMAGVTNDWREGFGGFQPDRPTRRLIRAVRRPC